MNKSHESRSNMVEVAGSGATYQRSMHDRPGSTRDRPEFAGTG